MTPTQIETERRVLLAQIEAFEKSIDDLESMVALLPREMRHDHDAWLNARLDVLEAMKTKLKALALFEVPATSSTGAPVISGTETLVAILILFVGLIPITLLRAWVLLLLVMMYGPALNVTATFMQCVCFVALFSYVAAQAKGAGSSPQPPTIKNAVSMLVGGAATAIVGLLSLGFVWFIVVR